MSIISLNTDSRCSNYQTSIFYFTIGWITGIRYQSIYGGGIRSNYWCL